MFNSLNKGLVTHLLLNKSSMSKDITSYENNGTNTDITLSTDRFGNEDGSYVFNNNTSGVRLTNVLPLNSSYSISLWCYFNGANERDILIGDYNLSGAINFNLERHLSNKLRIYYNSPDLYTDADVVTVDTWHHIVMIRDKENSKTYLYVDNELIYTYNGDIGDKNPTVPHYIGRDGRTGTTVMNGKIQDVRIYNRALSVDEIYLLYKQNEGNLKLSSLNKGLVLYYKLDETSGTVVKNYGSSDVDGSFKIQAIAYYPFNGNANDGSQSGKNGTVVDATLTTGRLGDTDGAYHFDGLSNGSKIETNLTPTTVRTLSVWYKTSDVSAASMVLIGNTAGQAGVYWARQSTNDWQVYWYYSGTNYRFRLIEPLADGNWHHEVLVFKTSTTQLLRYRDGALISTTNQDYTNTVTPGTLNVAGNVSGYTSFNGDIDEILIHQHESNSNDVNVLYQYSRYKDLNDPYRDGKIGKGSFDLWGIYEGASYCPCSYIDGGTTCLGIKNQEPWTMSMWVKPSNLTGARYRNSMGWYGGNYKGPWMYVTQDLRITVGQGNTTGSNSNHYTTITSVCTKGEWNHVVESYDGNYVRAYANGIKVYEYELGAYVDNGAGTQRFKVGSQPWDLNASSNAGFDDVRVYNRALTDEEVSLLYQQNEGNLKLNSLNKGLEMNLKLNEPLIKDTSINEFSFTPTIITTRYLRLNGNANDSSVNTTNGTLYGTTTTNGRLGDTNGALNFNGTSSDYIALGDLQMSNYYFISCWIKRDPTATGWNTIFSGRSNQYNNLAYNSDGRIAFGNFGGTWASIGGVVLTDTSNWHHIICQVISDGTNGTWKLWLDGIYIGESSSVTCDGNCSNAAIGRYANGSGAYFKGDIDEFMIVKEYSNSSYRRSNEYFRDLYRLLNVHDLGDPIVDDPLMGKVFDFDGFCYAHKTTEEWSVNTAESSYTVNMWIKPLAEPSNNAMWLFDNITTTNFTRAHFGPDTSKTITSIGAWAGGKHSAYASAAELADGNWHMLTAIYTKNTTDWTPVKMYLDGIYKGTSAADRTTPYSETLKLGTGYNYYSYDAYTTSYKGRMSKLKLYKKALSEEELTLLYQTEYNGYDGELISRYQLDGTTKALDLGSFSLHGITRGTSLTTDKDGIANKAYSFNGTSDYIVIPYSKLQAPTEGISVGAWMYRPVWTESTTRSIISKTEAGGWLIQCVSGYLRGFIHANGGYRNPQVALSTLSAGWHSIYLTYDGRYARLWVDGVNVNTVDLGATYPIAYAAANALAIGCEATGGATPTGQWFDGSMYDVRIYNRALTEAELLAIYNQ